jgi:hypothetical protein
MGQLEKSAKLSEQCVELAEEIDHPLTTAVALAQRTIFQAMQGQYEPLLSVADKLEKHCISQGLGPFANYAKVIRYHALAHLVAKPEIGSEAGSIRDGIERMRKELTLFAPRAFGMLAEAYLKSGLVAEGLVAIEEGIRLSRQGGQKLFLPELHRIRAALLLSQTPADRDSATAQLLEAVELAETMGSRLMTARALADLLGVQQSRGEQERAQVTLNKISALIADAPELGDLISLDAATH